MSDRKAFIDSLLKDFDSILPGHGNDKFYRDYLEGLSNAQFEQLVSAIESDEVILPLFAPNLGKAKLNIERNLSLGKKWGHEFFQQLWLTDPQDPSTTYLTPKKYLIIDLPMRRQAQTLSKKMSVPMDDTHMDDLTGQVTGDSKGSSVSFPELQMLYAHGLESTIVELIKVRGGDNEAYRQFDKAIVDTGAATLSEVTGGNTRVKSVKTLSALLKGAHLGNNL